MRAADFWGDAELEISVWALVEQLMKRGYVAPDHSAEMVARIVVDDFLCVMQEVDVND